MKGFRGKKYTGEVDTQKQRSIVFSPENTVVGSRHWEAGVLCGLEGEDVD